MEVASRESAPQGDSLPLGLLFQADLYKPADGFGAARRILLAFGPSVHRLHELIGKPEGAHGVSPRRGSAGARTFSAS